MRRRWWLALLALAAVLPILVHVDRTAAQTVPALPATECAATMTGIILANVVVPPGARCTLNGALVAGGVTLAGGNLHTSGSTIVRGVTVTSAVGSNDFCSSSIQGDVLVQGVADNVNRVGVIFGETDEGVTTCPPDTVSGSMQFLTNSNFELELDSATVLGNVTINDNSAHAIELEGNKVDGNLGCAGNTGAIGPNGRNTVAGQATGQCAAIVAPRPPSPRLVVIPPSGTAPLTVTFDGSGSLPGTGASLTSWSLNFGDGTPATAGGGAPPTAISHTYGSVALNTATLTVVQNDGQAASVSAVVAVGSPATTAPPATITGPAATAAPPLTGPPVTPPAIHRGTTPAMTLPPTPSTTITTPSTTAPSTTTTPPPTTGTTLPPGPPSTSAPASPTLHVVSLTGQPFGPAGEGLDVSGSNYPPSCPTAYFYFDNTRIGSAPVHGGTATARGLSAPGDARPGDHRVSSSCAGSGQSDLTSAAFRINPSRVHRTTFLTSLNQPRQLSLTLRSVGFSALITGLLLVLLGFPSQVFNSTLQEHYEEVRGWFGMRRRLSDIVNDLNQRFLFPVFLVAGGTLYACLTPDFGFNQSTLALATGMAIAVAATTVGFALPTFAYFGVRYRDRGRLLVLPGTVLIGAAFVVVSRLLHFQPGYLYGLLAVFVFHHEVDSRTGGRLAAVAAMSVMGLALVAWVARVPVSGATMGRGLGFWTVVLESALCGAFIIGLESILVGLLPLRFLDGSRIKEWSPTAWAVLFALALFVFIEVLIAPGSGYVGHTSRGGKVAVAVLYLLFAGFSFGFWGYFRYRRPRAEKGLAVEGDYGVR